MQLNLWERISKLGVTTAESDKYRRHILANRITLTIELFLLVNILVDYLTYWLNPSVNELSLFYTRIVFLVLLFNFLFAKLGWNLLLRVNLVYSPAVLRVILPLINGPVPFMFYFADPLIILAISVFTQLMFNPTIRNPYYSITIFFFAFLLFFLYDIIHFFNPDQADFFEVTGINVITLKIAMVTIFIVIHMIIYYLHRLNKLKEEKLEEANTALLQMNINLTDVQERLDKQNKSLAKKNVHLLKQERELSKANASKDKFFSIIAHDLKNPLNALIGLSGLLVDDRAKMSEEKQDKFAQMINQSGKEIFNLLENLLHWSRSQLGRIDYNPNRFLLCDSILPLITLVTPSANQKQITLYNFVDPELSVYADFAMINTVLRNLLANAIKFTPEGKNVFLNAEVVDDKVKISITDEGVGISPEDRKKLFAIDKTYKSVGTSGEKGTGLGLLLCKEFVEKNKGSIGVESEMNKGSTFWIILPINA